MHRIQGSPVPVPVPVRAPRTPKIRGSSPSGRAELLGVVEGQLEEIYRDLAVQVKRMTQLEAQASELRAAFRQLAGRRAGN